MYLPISNKLETYLCANYFDMFFLFHWKREKMAKARSVCSSSLYCHFIVRKLRKLYNQITVQPQPDNQTTVIISGIAFLIVTLGDSTIEPFFLFLLID